jgi:UDP-perosamine 4-acetyltransferase
MSKQVFLLGCGGHGRVVLDALLSSGVKVAGILDCNLSVGDQVFEVSVLGGDAFLHQVEAADVLLVNGLGANPNVFSRKRLFQEMQARGFLFDAVRHPSAVMGRECFLGDGCQIMAGAVLQNRVCVAENAVVNTGASIDHDCVLGSHSFISSGVVLCGDVKIADSAFIGAGAVVLPGIQIGADAVVGAGAVVTKAVPAGWTVAGNPAVKIGKTF